MRAHERKEALNAQTFSRPSAWRWMGPVLSLLASVSVTSAQDLISPDSGASTNPPPLFLQTLETNVPPIEPVVPGPTAVRPVAPQSAIVPVPTPVPAATPAVEQPFRWGPATFHPHLSYRFTYGNGLYSSPGNQHNTVEQTVSPGLGVSIGNVWRLDYTPSLNFYSDPNFRNTVDHAASLSGGTIYGDWTLGLSQTCSLTSEPRVETAQQTSQDAYVTSLSALYQFNQSMTLDLGVGQNLNFVGGGYANSVGSTKDWSTTDWLDYHWGPNLGAGLGAGFGYTAAEQGSDSTHESLQGRINWRALDKLSFSLSGGAQFIQYVDSSQPEFISPIYALSLIYQPFDVTTLTLTASRTASQSTYYANQVTETTGFNASLSQRLLGRLQLGLSGGYANTRYNSPVSGSSALSVTREDDYSFFGVSLSSAFLKRGSASVFYSWSSNSSNTSGYGYDSNQVGFQLAYGY